MFFKKIIIKFAKIWQNYEISVTIDFYFLNFKNILIGGDNAILVTPLEPLLELRTYVNLQLLSIGCHLTNKIKTKSQIYIYI